MQKPEWLRSASRSTSLVEGTLSINYRPDVSFAYGRNLPGVFSGTILNRENIGKTSDELVALWNEANPQDQVAS